MIRTIVGLAVAGIALSPFADKTGTPTVKSPVDTAPWVAEYGVDPIITSAGSPDVRHLRVATADGQCMLSVTNMADVKAEPSCGDVFAGLENAKGWKASGDFATISDASGHAILEIGASDGFAYEGTSATGGVVTLTDADI